MMTSVDLSQIGANSLTSGLEIANEYKTMVTTSHEDIVGSPVRSSKELLNQEIEPLSNEKEGATTLPQKMEDDTEFSLPEDDCVDIGVGNLLENPSNAKTPDHTSLPSLSPVKRPRHKPGERKGLLLMAVKDVLEQNISMRKAAQRYNLAKSSLCDFVRKNNIKLPNNRYKTASTFNASTPSNKDAPQQTALFQKAEDIRKYLSALESQSKNIDMAGTESRIATHLSFGSFKIPLNVMASRSNFDSGKLSADNFRSQEQKNRIHSNSILSRETSISSAPNPTGNVSPIYNSIESPWQNVSGLPTQVPIRNWGLWPIESSKISHCSIPMSTYTKSSTPSSFNFFLSKQLFAQSGTALDANSHISSSNFRFGNSNETSLSYSTTTTDSLRKVSPEILAHMKPSTLSIPSSDIQSQETDFGLSSSLTDASSSLPASCCSLTSPTSLLSDQSTDLIQNRIKSYQSIELHPANLSTLNRDSQPSSLTKSFCNLPLLGSPTSVQNERSRGAQFLNASGLSSSTNSNHHSSTETNFLAGTFPEISHNSSMFQLKSTSLENSILHTSLASSSTAGFGSPTLTTLYQKNPENRSSFPAARLSSTTELSSMDSRMLSDVSRKIAELQRIAACKVLAEGSYADETLLSQLQQSILSSLYDNANVGKVQIPFNLPIATPTSMQKTPIAHFSKDVDHVKGLLNFINNSPSPFHVVRSVCEILGEHGFRELRESDVWKIYPNDCFYITRNSSSIFAVTVGGAYQPSNGLSILGAHTDSPCLRLKPKSGLAGDEFIHLNAETYGQGSWYTWLDRDLTLAGRCILRLPNGTLEQRLVNIQRPIACIPSVDIKSRRLTNPCLDIDDFCLAPILCTSLSDQSLHSEREFDTVLPTDRNLTPEDQDTESSSSISAARQPYPHLHPYSVMKLVADAVNCEESEIVEVELCFADTQMASLGGAQAEFIHASRLEAQFNAYAGIQGLIGALPSLKNDIHIRIVCLYDNELTGSGSAQGANSTFTATVLKRIIHAFETNLEYAEKFERDCLYEQTIPRSFLLAASQACVPIRPRSSQDELADRQNFDLGLVLKYDFALNCATNSLTAAIVKEIASRANVPIQDYFLEKNESRNATLGSILSSQLGISAAEIGGIQLTMHSCRETIPVASVPHAVSMYSSYFHNLPSILKTVYFK